MKSTKLEFSTGISANNRHIGISHFAQCFFLNFINEITPDIENSGRYAATLAHLADESGKKFCLAGISAGKKRLCNIIPYRCDGLWNTKFQPFKVLPDLGVSIQVIIAGMNIAPASATPITDSNASAKNVFNVTLNFGSVRRQRK